MLFKIFIEMFRDMSHDTKKPPTVATVDWLC